MSKIYISYSNLDKELGLLFCNRLKESGHEILIDRDLLQPGIGWRDALTDSLKQADVVLVLLTDKSTGSQYVLSEIGAARAYISSFPDDKLLIPVIFDNVEIPLVIQDIHCLFSDRNNVDEAIIAINHSIDSLLGRRVAKEQKREERQAKIEKTAASYIEITITDLQKREKKLSSFALAWNIVGWVSLLSGVIAAVCLMIYSMYNKDFSPKDWPSVTFLGIKSLIIITLLIASAKYAFSLAKSYMCESLKNSDRIHAISFGKFFLQAFGESVDANDVKEVFQNWNISGASAFSTLEATSFDPKIVEAIVSVTDVVRKDHEKSKK